MAKATRGNVIVVHSKQQPLRKTDIEAARSVAFRYLGYSARSTHEMRRRLEKDTFPEEIIAAVIEEIVALGYLDDEEFTDRWIEDRADRKGYGKCRLASELARKGIQKEQIKEAVGKISSDDELKRAVAAADKKLPQEQALRLSTDERREAERKLCAFLQRRGFSYDIVRQVLQQRMMK